jgi:hypothetical protein
MIDDLTVIHGVIGLCLEGTLGELSDQQRENLMMAERHVWDLDRFIGELMGVKINSHTKNFGVGINRVYKRLRR